MRAARAELIELLLRASPKAPWAGQVQRVREWYEPHLERIYEQAQVRAGDLEQLERIAPQFRAARALPHRAGARSAAARPATCRARRTLDEDYLVLSTIHSAKGQEWDAVYVLNVADGSFPSEFATGSAELIEEERRLLYVAMTRAKTRPDLHRAAQVLRDAAVAHGRRARLRREEPLPHPRGDAVP